MTISILRRKCELNALIFLNQVISKLSKISKSLIFLMLVACICHNCCFIKVASSWLRKMVAHVIAFETPMPKVYNVLPPPVDELDDILAILFTGPLKPTEADLSHVPLLVRRNQVAKALEWLKLNHIDYSDLDISYENLKKYPEDCPTIFLLNIVMNLLIRFQKGQVYLTRRWMMVLQLVNAPLLFMDLLAQN
jgi:hypothetical protein